MKKIVAVLCTVALMGGLVSSMPASAAIGDNYAGVQTVTNKNGLVLAIHEDSGVNFLYEAKSGYYFKDLNKNGKIDAYEDWRNDVDTRIANLLSLMDTDSKLQLMCHNGTVASGNRMAVQRSADAIATKGTMADNGNLNQKNAEATAFGIPYAHSTDPRHTGASDPGTDPGQGHGPEPIEDWPDNTISRWPNTSALANTFSPEWHTKFGATKATEYIAQQIWQELGPLYDQTTEPRWSRNAGAVTEDYDLLIDLVQAEVTAMQTADETYEDYGLPAGWGRGSVSAMAKHMLGTGGGEYGYEGHADQGAFSAYPANGWRKMTDAMCAAGGIGTQPKDSVSQVNAVMTQYSMPTDQAPYGLYGSGNKLLSNVGGAFNRYVMTGVLREEKGWDGMITSDWGVYGSGFGVTNNQGFDTASRVLVSWLAGMDQLGGFNTWTEMKAAYNKGIEGDAARGIPAYGQAYMDEMVDNRAGHALRTLFKLGLFENPYVDPEWTKENLGSSELVKLGHEAHQAAIVMLKNSDNTLPVEGGKELTAYTAQVGSTWNLDRTALSRCYSIPSEIKNAGNTALSAADKKAAADKSDFAIIKFTGPSPSNGGTWSAGATNLSVNSVQFAPYTKEVGREVSLGGYWRHSDGSYVKAWELPDASKGDYKENRCNIGWKNTGLQSTLNMIMETKELMGDKPVIAILDYRTPTICAEFEPYVDAIIVSCSGSDTAYLEVISGVYEPTGMLASTWPRSMALVEMSAEDVPDTTPYVDGDNNVYQFGFGLNYSGRIVDDRTAKYIGLSEIKSFEVTEGDTIKVPIQLLPYKYGPAGVTASVHYDKSLLKVTKMESAAGFLLTSAGDKFTLATVNGSNVETGAIAGYVTFEAIASTNEWDDVNVTFAMDDAAKRYEDGNANATMARFADVLITVKSGMPMLGDVSLDGIVNVGDAVLLLQYLAGNLELSAKQLVAADVNQDGNIDTADVIIIMQMCL